MQSLLAHDFVCPLVSDVQYRVRVSFDGCMRPILSHLAKCLAPRHRRTEMYPGRGMSECLRRIWWLSVWLGWAQKQGLERDRPTTKNPQKPSVHSKVQWVCMGSSARTSSVCVWPQQNVADRHIAGTSRVV